MIVMRRLVVGFGRLDVLALALVDGTAALPRGAEESIANLLTGLALYRYGALSDFARARPFYERALAIREKTLGPDGSTSNPGWCRIPIPPS
jgi:hypothetical protein